MKKLLLSIITLVSGVMSLQAQVTNYAVPPYCNSFESGTLDAHWYTTSSGANGRIQIWDSQTLTWGGNTATAFSGENWLGLDNDPGGTYVTNEAWLGFDMTGQSNLRFKFKWAEWNDETEAVDGIFISDNGGTTFTQIINLQGGNYTDLAWQSFNFDLDSINTVHGLSFTSTYVIKFQQYDNYYFAGGNDGFLFDDIFVGNGCSDCSGVLETACTNYTVPSGDESYTSSGVYVDTVDNGGGCNSFLEINLTLTGGSASAATISPTACAMYTVPSGDETYTTSGTYMDTIPSSSGCDSVLTINLTVNQAATSTTTISACDSYMWTDGNTYTTTGMYTQVLTAANGCDSTATLDLTIGTTPSVTITSTDGVNLLANGAATTYTWIDCADSSVVGTGSTFMPSDNGDYAVIGDDNGCTDTSACFAVVSISINEFSNSMVSIYPNPTKELLSINTNEVLSKIFVMDNSGRVVIEAENTTKQLDVSSLAKGRYILVLVNKQGARVEKSFVKQ